eukprot:507909-Pleurochrysis_carterae.AAC.1
MKERARSLLSFVVAGWHAAGAARPRTRLRAPMRPNAHAAPLCLNVPLCLQVPLCSNMLLLRNAGQSWPCKDSRTRVWSCCNFDLMTRSTVSVACSNSQVRSSTYS